MREKPLLIIPIETKVRELDAKLLLSVIALRKGFDVIIGAIQEMKYLVDLLDRGIYLDKAVTNTKFGHFFRYRKMGHKIAVLDEEGLVYFDADVYLQTRIHEKSFNYVSKLFTWGPEQAKVISSAVASSLAQRITVTGNPRFDLLRRELWKVYQSDVAARKGQYGRIILVNTNFGFVNRDTDTSALQKTFSNSPISKKRPGFYEGWTAAQKKVMCSFQEMLPLLRRHFPEHTVIIRPHPSERLDIWNKAAASMQKMQVVREGNVVPWILASDALIHWNCTTAIEAFFLNKPAFAYREERVDQYEQHLPNVCSYHAYSAEELLAMMKQAMNGTLEFSSDAIKARDNALQQHIAPLEGKLAAEHMVNELFEISKSFKRERSLKEKGLQKIKRLWRHVLDLLDPGRHERDHYISIKFPDTEIKEIQERVQTLSECLNYRKDISVEKVQKNCFSLTVSR